MGLDEKNQTREDLLLARKIAELVQIRGGRAYLVGGCVRDQLLGLDYKDIDIEIHGVCREELEEILDGLGQRIDTGSSYGVYGLKGYELDIALPRREKAIGQGHKDFQITLDPWLGTQNAAIRRDFTINALMQDILSGEIVDHFSGLQDLKEGRIRQVHAETFVEDPLRLLRAAQFAARFRFRVADDTIALCQQMGLDRLTGDRVCGEMKKAMMKSDKPSIFFEELRRMDQLDVWFPEAKALIGIPQNPAYHQEGDAWQHTMMVLDQAAACRQEVHRPWPFMLAALCHDFGKAVATEWDSGSFHAYGHEVKGLPIVRSFLERLTSERQTIDYVLNMVELHMKPHSCAFAGAAVKKTNKMYDEAVEPYDLIRLAECDARSTINDLPYVSHEAFLLERLAIYEDYMSRPYVMGRDLIRAGLKPNVYFSEILAYAHKLRLAGIAKEEALKQTLAYARRYDRV